MKNDFVFFWGGIFSNFYPAKINIDGIEYLTTEQYFMSSKALFFGDLEINQLIMEAKTPEEAKKLGRKIKNFDSEEWSKVCRDFMYKGNYAKYTQHKNLQKELLLTGNKTLVESSPYDEIWGIKLREDDPLAWNKETWQGTNWLGETLVKVRDQIVKEKSIKSVLIISEKIIEHESVINQDLLDIKIDDLDKKSTEEIIEYIYKSNEFSESEVDKNSVFGMYIIEKELI